MTIVSGHYRVCAVLVVAALWGTTARADERWTSEEYGTVTYERDIGRWAVWPSAQR